MIASATLTLHHLPTAVRSIFDAAPGLTNGLKILESTSAASWSAATTSQFRRFDNGRLPTRLQRPTKWGANIGVLSNSYSAEPIDLSSTRLSHGGQGTLPITSRKLVLNDQRLEGLLMGWADGIMITMTILSALLSICDPTRPLFLNGSTSSHSG